MNADKVLSGFAKSIHAHLKHARRDGMFSLTEYMKVGGELSKAKEVLKRGQFGSWVEANFGFSRAWAALLMKLYENWLDVSEAVEDAAERRDTLATRRFTVEGALKLYEEKRRNASAAFKTPVELLRKETATARAKREAAVAQRRVVLLEGRNVMLEHLLQEHGIPVPPMPPVPTEQPDQQVEQAEQQPEETSNGNICNDSANSDRDPTENARPTEIMAKEQVPDGGDYGDTMETPDQDDAPRRDYTDGASSLINALAGGVPGHHR